MLNLPSCDTVENGSGSVSVEFLDGGKMSEFYYRNNRTSGQKSLRCFPSCGPHHIETTFCGRPIRCKIIVGKGDHHGHFNVDNILLLGEFRCCETGASDDPLSSKAINIFDLGGICVSDLSGHLKTRSEGLHQFYNGSIISFAEFDTHYEIFANFNDERLSWHYGWRGNRYKVMCQHEFVVSVMHSKEMSSTSQKGKFFNLLCQASSPSFRVLSLRRKLPKSNVSSDILEDGKSGEIVDENGKRPQESMSAFTIFPMQKNKPKYSLTRPIPNIKPGNALAGFETPRPIIQSDFEIILDNCSKKRSRPVPNEMLNLLSGLGVCPLVVSEPTKKPTMFCV